jgi:hypothetical protein
MASKEAKRTYLEKFWQRTNLPRFEDHNDISDVDLVNAVEKIEAALKPGEKDNKCTPFQTSRNISAKQ